MTKFKSNREGYFRHYIKNEIISVKSEKLQLKNITKYIDRITV